jgi:hypothetical protein
MGNLLEKLFDVCRWIVLVGSLGSFSLRVGRDFRYMDIVVHAVAIAVRICNKKNTVSKDFLNQRFTNLLCVHISFSSSLADPSNLRRHRRRH